MLPMYLQEKNKTATEKKSAKIRKPAYSLKEISERINVDYNKLYRIVAQSNNDTYFPKEVFVTCKKGSCIRNKKLYHIDEFISWWNNRS